MPKKIGFDATTITKNHNGGKDQVALNLLCGFEKNGLGDNFVVFCIPEMLGYIDSLIPSARVVPVISKRLWKKSIEDIFTRTFELPRYVKEYEVGVLLFPISNTGLCRYSIPTVVIPHDIQTQSHKERFSLKTRLKMDFFYHFDFKLRDWIVAISNFDKEEIASFYPMHKKKIIVIYNPIRTDFFTMTEPSVETKAHRAPVSNQIVEPEMFAKPYITAINIQYGHKNTITLIKAFEKIVRDIPHSLYLIGIINLETSSLLDYVENNSLSDRVKFLGFLDNIKLAEILKGSDLYVNPSSFEGFGMTSIEAMLSGVPTLVSAVSAVPEVTMGLCQYYEPAEDEEELSRAIKKILLADEKENDEKLRAIGDQVRDRYDYVKISLQYFDFLTSNMQDRRNFR